MTDSILVIEDDEMVRHAVARVLEAHGFNPTFAENGKEGLALFQRLSPVLVITDLIMPEKEGIETIMEMRKQRSDVRIVAMSGGGRVGAPEAFLKTAKSLGADEVLAKPFEPEQLVAVVKRQLAAGRSQAAAPLPLTI